MDKTSNNYTNNCENWCTYLFFKFVDSNELSPSSLYKAGQESVIISYSKKLTVSLC